MKKLFILSLMVLVTMSLAACPGRSLKSLVRTAVDSTPTMSVVMAEFIREVNPSVAQTEIDTLVDGNSTFAWNLYKEVVKEEKGNVFFSPYSISSAFAMLWAGARGKTESEMAKTLSYNLPQDSLHRVFNAVDQKLAQRGQYGVSTNGERLKLNIANALWGERTETFSSDFLNVLAFNYGAGMHLMNFMGAPEESRKLINNWVAENTNQKIIELLTKGMINDETRFVLTNTVYFNAAWNEEFDPGSTKDEDFKLVDGKVVKVPLMRTGPNTKEQIHGEYAEGETWQIAVIHYSGAELFLFIILPKEGKFYEVEKSLDASITTEMATKLISSRVQLELPKVELEKELNLKKILDNMGMSDAFNESRADYTGMNTKPGLGVSASIHKAYVKMSEKGTEASAASGIVNGIGYEPPLETFIVNRPYIFLIRDDKTGAVLFLGRVMNPLE